MEDAESGVGMVAWADGISMRVGNAVHGGALRGNGSFGVFIIVVC